jgi:hypothetical protein
MIDLDEEMEIPVVKYVPTPIKTGKKRKGQLNPRPNISTLAD